MAFQHNIELRTSKIGDVDAPASFRNLTARRVDELE
jgi:hypothetical protein